MVRHIIFFQVEDKKNISLCRNLHEILMGQVCFRLQDEEDQILCRVTINEVVWIELRGANDVEERVKVDEVNCIDIKMKRDDVLYFSKIIYVVLVVDGEEHC